MLQEHDTEFPQEAWTVFFLYFNYDMNVFLFHVDIVTDSHFTLMYDVLPNVGRHLGKQRRTLTNVLAIRS